MLSIDLRTTREQFNVHYLGPEMEICILPLYRELAVLFPAATIVIEMVGPVTKKFLPKSPVRFEGRLGGSVTIRVHGGRGMHYHNPSLDLHPTIPDVCVACNAGLAAPEYAWGPTLKLIRQRGVPFVFTDYSEQGVEKSLSNTADLYGLKVIQNTCLNPFRAPVRKPLINNGSVGFPWLANGFIGACTA